MTYVATGSVKLAIVLDIENDDVEGTAAVILDDLIRTMVSTTTNDQGLRASLIDLDQEDTLADTLLPDELKSAVTIVVDAWKGQNNKASRLVLRSAYPQLGSCR